MSFCFLIRFFGQFLQGTPPERCCSVCNKFDLSEAAPPKPTVTRAKPVFRSVVPQEEAKQKLQAWRTAQATKMGSLWGDELVMTDAELNKIAKEAKRTLQAADVPASPEFREEIFNMLGAPEQGAKRRKTK